MKYLTVAQRNLTSETALLHGGKLIWGKNVDVIRAWYPESLPERAWQNLRANELAADDQIAILRDENDRLKSLVERWAQLLEDQCYAEIWGMNLADPVK